MFRNYRQCLSAIVIVLAAAAQPLAGQTVSPPEVPTDLRVPAGNTPFLKGYATGTQNYVCLPTPTGLAWKFQGPQATVFIKFLWIRGEVSQQIMTHYLSPNPIEDGTPARATWQSSLDTSAVWAKKIAETSDSVYVAAGAIPWFLLQAVGGLPGPTGGTMLARTTFIQRVNTSGGTMPATACTEAGSLHFAPYTAEYVFYQPGSSQ